MNMDLGKIKLSRKIIFESALRNKRKIPEKVLFWRCKSLYLLQATFNLDGVPKHVMEILKPSLFPTGNDSNWTCDSEPCLNRNGAAIKMNI